MEIIITITRKLFGRTRGEAFKSLNDTCEQPKAPEKKNNKNVEKDQAEGVERRSLETQWKEKRRGGEERRQTWSSY